MYNIILVIHVILAVCLVGIILIQRPDSNSLAGLSGGGDNMSFLSGRAAGNLLTKMTSILAVLFIVTSLSLAFMARGTSKTESAIITDAPATTQQAPAQDAPLKAPPRPPVSKE